MHAVAVIMSEYTLPKLPYAYNVSNLVASFGKLRLTSQALEPYISEQIMTLHHSKHHQTYVNNLNAAQITQASADLVAQLHLQVTMNFNAGGHINHTLFWKILCPPSSSGNPGAAITKAIDARWGSLQGFKDTFKTILLGIKGSGWGWLVQDNATGNLELLTSRDQDIVPAGKKPLLGIDMWEHAYYLQYLNDKPEYVNGIWNIINWLEVEKRFSGGEAEVWGDLGKLKSMI